MTKNLDQIIQWAIDNKILDTYGFTQSYKNILNSYLVQDEPTIAIFNSVKSYCYEICDTEIKLLAAFVTFVLSTYDTPFGKYLKHFDETPSEAEYSKINDAVSQVKFDKENK